MRKELYRALTERLKQLVVDDAGEIKLVSREELNRLEAEGSACYAVKHTGLWNRQAEFITEEEPFDMPAVFVEFGKIAWQALSGGGQYAEITVGLHILQRWMPEEYNELAYLDLLEKINRCLNGFSGDCFGSMVRTLSIPCHDHEEILDSTEWFKTRGVDMSAATDEEQIKIKPAFGIKTRKAE